MTSVIKQIVKDGEYGTQTIKMVVKDSERGPKGEDGVIQYTAGAGIRIKNNVISAIGGGGGGGNIEWGDIEGDIADQTDLQNELSQYEKAADLSAVATSGSYDDLTNKPTIPTVNNATITITSNGTTAGSFTTNSSSNKTIALTSPVITMTTTDPGEGAALAANNFIAVYSE